MDDSDEDFVDLSSKPLKRVCKKPRQPRKAGHPPSSQASDGGKRRRNNRRDDGSGSKCVAAVGGTQPVCTEAEQLVVSGGGDAGPSVSVASAAAVPRAERRLAAKDVVLNRMQQFRRASPQRMLHRDRSQSTERENNRDPASPQTEKRDTPESSSSGLCSKPLDSDEALALQLQQELDREAAEAQTVDLEDGGLFFCQICHKNLTHMTPEGRTQHLNRCLDASELHVPAPPPPPGVPDCPICGKKFKSQRSRSSHLKRCSSDMGVSPAVLLQALQRQTEESQSTAAANTLAQTGGTKRKGPSKPGLPASKKPRKKTEPLDEDTRVALALSSSLVEQERESHIETAASHASITPMLRWRPDTGKGHGKRKKGAVPRPPPLLLVQDAEAALTRLQERISALLLRSRAPSPPTPTRCPSSLPGWSGAAPLWQKSALLNQDSTGLSDFYVPELREFITPRELATTDVASSSTSHKPDTSLRPVSEGTPVTKTRPSIMPSTSQTASYSPASSTPGTRQLPMGGEALRDLMELAEDGMTLTQCGYAAPGPAKDKSAKLSTNLQLSGFVLEEEEEHADLCVSGFLPETLHAHAEETHGQARRMTESAGGHQSVALSRLASELSSMVNNPQLSDVQLQVDSGEVYFAHSFMVYARCPLLAEMVHESGFGVKEEGMPAAQRVLMSDVPGQAVLALLQYLYTAQYSIPASLQPHVVELASRFDLQELQQLCELQRAEADYTSQEEHLNKSQTDLAFMELLHSMWNEEDDDDDDDERTDADGGRDEERGLEQCQAADVISGDGEFQEEQVNEEEMEEIYEFAATQRKREEEEESVEEKVDEEEDGEVFTKLTKPERSSRGFSEKSSQPNSSLDRSYNRLFSDSWGVYKEGDDPSSLHPTSPPPKTHTLQSQQHQSPHKPFSEYSGRTLLQSSASVVNDLSLSPPPSTSNLPIPGLSPGIVADGGGDAVELEECLPLKQESLGPHSICVPLSPDSPQKKKTPELVVLSDSSDEMEVVDVAVLSSRSPSPPYPSALQTLQSFTHIKPQMIPKSKEPSSLHFSPNDPSSVTVPSRPGSGCDQSVVDCSPEVSWLVPSTPVQPRRSTTTSSTQTRSSMCRTRLFPKGEASSPSSSVFSSPALPFNNRSPTSNNPTGDSAHVGPADDSVSKQDRTVPSSSSLDFNFCPKRTSSCITSEDREVDSPVFKEPQLSHLSSSTLPCLLQASSKQHNSLHLQLQPYSSTPLHTDLHQPPVSLAASPLHIEPDKQRPTSKERDRAPSESPEKTELGSFHLSPLSDPSDPPSSSSQRGLQSSRRRSKSSSQSQRSVEYSSHNGTGSELRSGIRNKEEGREIEHESKGTDDKGEQEEAKGESREAEAAESSFQQSFMAMDEPPIAFNDSWGFNACVDLAENPGCFSLRLEDSGASSLQEHSSEKAKSSHHVSLNGQGGVTASAPSKALSSQPPTSEQAHTGPSFTPSPPDPTTHTTPEIINSLLDSKIWDSWEEEEVLPLSQRVNPSASLKTPLSLHNKRRRSVVPITPMPHYSDMDTPELKNKLNRFGVRPLPKRQMILKLKEIHQYTHQLVSSDSEDEAPSVGRTAQIIKPPSTSLAAAGSRLVSCAQRVKFKEPTAVSPVKLNREEEAEPLSASQGSNTSSTAASEESERSNPEICLSSDGDSDSDGGISASQSATRLQDRLRAVRSFILSDSGLYSQILQYQPLVLSQLQQQLKAAGIRLGAAKLVDYLDSQCITFTTAKPGHTAPSRRRGKKTGKGAKAAG